MDITEEEFNKALARIKETNEIRIWEGWGAWYAGTVLENGEIAAIHESSSSRGVSFSALRILRNNDIDPTNIKFNYNTI